MKGRKQKISEDTWLQKSRAEPEGYAEGQTYMRITENNLNDTNIHIDILSRTITIERLRQAGFVFFSDYYKSVRVII